ncbi:hypothetical protein E2C01_086651 [Portunus trituberculatus]|uniref:Uncharacterized protein n=1 Tax=Portunus trituberculatus TaxID=210409 RepID=A0A5B7JAA6_PORTR|nr:hypothetical protein [Portunus trituberculatus]
MRWNERVLWNGTRKRKLRSRALCVDVNARNYRWSESRSKVCYRCVTWGRMRRWSMSCWSVRSMRETGME